MKRWTTLLVLPVLAACHTTPPGAVGTLEYDRIVMPAVASERVLEVAARPGQRVKAGQLLLQLDPARAQMQVVAAEAKVRQTRASLAELDNGARHEDVAKARAQRDAAAARAREAQDNYTRMHDLRGKGYVSQSVLDQARASLGSARGDLAAAQAALARLQHGSRAEIIAQARAALAGAEAEARLATLQRDKLAVHAPRDGIVDAIPYHAGDQPPAGAPVVVELVGRAPYARVYLSAAQHARVHVGDAVRVQVPSLQRSWPGRVRRLRGEPVFTPYYALSGEDAQRLSYIAEVVLDPGARDLPAGLPVRVELQP